jgi:uroporphyrinogen-III synthase
MRNRFLLPARLSKAPVVITRPLAQATPLAARLLAQSIDARIFPLLDIQPLTDTTALEAIIARLSDYAMVAFVSPNAIDATFAHLVAWPSGVIAAVVGEGSRQALARHGVTEATASIVSPADTLRTDSETLLEVLDLDRLAGRKVLIIRAETGRELLAERLREAGINVEQIAAYRRGAPVLDEERRQQLQTLIATGCDWVITSSEALRHLKSAALEATGAEGWARLQHSRLIVPHERIAETALEMEFTHVTQTASGDEALIRAIQSLP